MNAPLRSFDPALRPDLVRTKAVDLIRYVGGGKLTFGTYASATAAMLACDDTGLWIANGDGTFRSQDGRTLIEPVRT